jgi:hypothetical protein
MDLPGCSNYDISQSPILSFLFRPTFVPRRYQWTVPIRRWRLTLTAASRRGSGGDLDLLSVLFCQRFALYWPLMVVPAGGVAGMELLDIHSFSTE